MTDIQQRSIEFRSAVEGRMLTGYAQVYGTYGVLPAYVETFAPTAFDAILSDPASDVRSFWNHDSASLLGRQSAGTLRVWSDSTGLGFEVDLPNTTVGNDIRELAERGDIGGVSVSFIPGDIEYGRIGNRELRTHTSVARLVELSPCSIPVYSSTSVQLRADIPTPAIDGRTQLARAELAHYLNDRTK